jgi:hypothetical protein
LVELTQEIRDEYKLYAQNPVGYEKKVDSISDMFGLTKKNRLKTDYCAVYVVGKFQTAPIVFFGVNPGYSSNNSPIEQNEANRGNTIKVSISIFFNTFPTINLNHHIILLYGISFLD